MKKKSLFISAMCISLFFVLGIVAFPSGDSDSEREKQVDQHFTNAVDFINKLMFDEAIGELEQVIKLVPESKMAQDAQYWIGQSYYKAGNFDDALSTLEKLMEENPKSAIIPVTQLMVDRVQQAKENEKLKRTTSDALDKGVIIDPNTGLTYTKAKTFFGKNDVIDVPTRLHLSPNGKYLLQDNLVIPMNGEEPFNLVDMQALRGIWSPDGKKVAFYSEGSICVIPVSPNTGRVVGPAKKLLDGKYWFQRSVSWSPDSDRIVFARRDRTTDGDIWILSVKDGALKQITYDPLPEHRPQWSPDGKTIAYEKYDDNYNSFWLVSSEGGMARKPIDNRGFGSWSPDSKGLIYEEGGKLNYFRLADERVFDCEFDPPSEVGTFFSWSPDGKKMLFYSSSYDWRSPLKVVSVTGGPVFELGSQLPLSTLWAYTRGWSSDSRMIIAHGVTKDRDNVLWIISLAGGDPFPLELDISVPGKSDIGHLDDWGNVGPISPDRKKLLFFVNQSDNTKDLWMVPVSLKDGRTTGPAVMVLAARDGISPGDAVWSPDGKRLAVIFKDDIWIASTEEDKPIQITNTPEQEIWPVWSPDGEMIAYMLGLSIWGEKEHRILHVISISEDEATEVLRTAAGRNQYAWSPDSKEIAVISQGIISAISIAGGKTRQIVDLKHQEFFVEDGIRSAWGLSWHPGGKYITFISQKERVVNDGIFMVPANGGKITELVTDDPGEKYLLYPSPDGKWISYNSDGFVKTRSEGTIWEAEFEQILGKILD
jgi:Tol biopolymer transport system component